MLRNIKSLFFKNDQKTNLNFIFIDPKELKFFKVILGKKSEKYQNMTNLNYNR